MIIDAHTHGFHSKYLEKIEAIGGSWIEEKIAFMRKKAKRQPTFLDVAMRIDQIERNGIDLQVVTPSQWFDSNVFPAEPATQLAFAKAINDNMARIMEDSKGRFITAGSIPLTNFEQGSRKEMDRVIKTLGMKAVTVTSHIAGKPLDSPEFEAFWAHAVELDIAVYIHPDNPAGHVDRSYEYDYDLTHNFGWPFETTLALSRLVFSGMMEKYPSLRILSHHLGGGMVPFFMGRINETYNPDDQEKKIGHTLPMPLFDYFSMFYYDTAVGGSAAAVRCAYEVFGADRLVFATDAPQGPADGEVRLKTYPGIVRSLGLSEEENQKIFEGNAKRLLKLS